MPRSRSKNLHHSSTGTGSSDETPPGAGQWFMARLDLNGVGLIDPEQAVPLLLEQGRTARGGYAVLPLRKKPNAKSVGSRLALTVGPTVRAVADIFRPEAPDHFGPDMRVKWTAAGVPPEEIKAWVVVHNIQEVNGLTVDDITREDGSPLGKYETDKTLRAIRFKPGRQPM